MQWKKKTFKEEHLNAAEEEEHLGDESSEAEGDFAFCTFSLEENSCLAAEKIPMKQSSWATLSIKAFQ